MNYFSIRDVENLSGIKAHTWRIWEQRHQICLPQRKESLHRFYDAENLKHILRISYLYHSGIKISKIARLKDSEVIKMASDIGHSIPLENYFIKELIEASLDCDDEKFQATCDELFSSNEFEHCILNIIYPFLERIGVLWLTDHLLPAQEHFSSSILSKKFIAAIDSLPNVNNQDLENILLFTPEKEHHELPLLFLHFLLKKNHKQVTYFGSNIKLSHIKEFVAENKISKLHFHLVTNLTNKSSEQYLSEVAAAFPNQQIIMSGSQSAYVKSHAENARVLTSMQQILEYAKS